MRAFIVILVLFTSTLASAQEQRLKEIQNLQPTDQQVQALFGLFLSKVPQMLQDTDNVQNQVSELAPQALQILSPKQRAFLSEMAPTESMDHFKRMTEQERKQFFFDSARRLAHPSKAEWIDKMEAFTSQ